MYRRALFNHITFNNANVDVDEASDKGIAYTLLDHLNDSGVLADARSQARHPGIISDNDAFAGSYSNSKPKVVEHSLSDARPPVQSPEAPTGPVDPALNGSRASLKRICIRRIP